MKGIVINNLNIQRAYVKALNICTTIKPNSNFFLMDHDKNNISKILSNISIDIDFVIVKNIISINDLELYINNLQEGVYIGDRIIYPWFIFLTNIPSKELKKIGASVNLRFIMNDYNK